MALIYESKRVTLMSLVIGILVALSKVSYIKHKHSCASCCKSLLKSSYIIVNLLLSVENISVLFI